MNILENLGIDLTFWGFMLFAFGGILTGIINTLAGSGSLITLPIFMFICGLPAPLANGTNRIGALAQTITGLIGFKNNGVSDFKGSWWMVAPAILGSAIGSYIAVDIDDRTMKMAIGGLMVFMFFFLLLNPKRWLHESEDTERQLNSWQNILAFFLIGIYGGFIMAGMGIFLLSALVLISKYSLKEGNAIKVLIGAALIVPAVFIFCFSGQIHWGYGILMAIFQSLGAWLGVRFIAKVPNANTWIYRLLLLIVAVAAIKTFSGLL